MKSFSEEPGRLVWRGHPLLGDAFTVTATRKAVAAGTEWEFAYEGNGTDWFVEEVAFPEWTVPRTGRTRVFYPRISGMVLSPAWGNVPAGKTVAKTGPGFGAPHCIAAIGEDGASFYLDRRGDARCYAARFEIAQGAKADGLGERGREAVGVADDRRAVGYEGEDLGVLLRVEPLGRDGHRSFAFCLFPQQAERVASAGTLTLARACREHLEAVDADGYLKGGESAGKLHPRAREHRLPVEGDRKPYALEGIGALAMLDDPEPHEVKLFGSHEDAGEKGRSRGTVQHRREHYVRGGLAFRR